MRLMCRVRDGKVAVYEQGCIDSGRWTELVEKKREPPKPRPPSRPRPLKPLVRKTTDEQVAALFAPPSIEPQKEPA